MRTFSFRTKIFACVLLATLTALALPLVYARVTLHNDLLNDAKLQALREAQLAGRLLDALPPYDDAQKALHEWGTPDMRLTLLTRTGEVLADSQLTADQLPKLDNHADRPEFRDALDDGKGVSTRYSNTLNNDLVYAVVALRDGNMLRVAVPFAGLKSRIDSKVTTFSGVAVAATLISLLLAILLSFWLKRELGQMVNVVEAISLGKYHRRLRRLPGREFIPLADAVNRMAQNIEEHVYTVADQKEQLETILDTMNEGVLVLSPHGCIRRCNRALARNFPAASGAHGSQVVEVIPVPALQDAVDDILHNPTVDPNVPVTLQVEMPPGRVFAVQICRAPRESQDLGAVAVFHDITELVRLERVRRDFVANVSHELRTPLTAIQGYAETLADMQDMPQECRRFGEIIRKNGMHLNRMVEELLSLARLENEDSPLSLAPVRLEESLQSAQSLCRNLLETRSLRVQVQMPEDIMALANAPSLAQVFRNLLENAARYAPKGTEILVHAAVRQQQVLVQVCDNGPGIPASDLKRIFERFYRVEKHRTSVGTGTGPSTGLGLAICKHIVERHGGQIWADSPASPPPLLPSHWATALCFTLPLATGE